MPNPPEVAIAAAEHQSEEGPQVPVGTCLKQVRGCYGVAAKYGDAATAWKNAEHKRRTTDPQAPPRGAPVWWTGGSEGYGHVAISAGDGFCWSTDINRAGYFDLVRIADIQRKWGMPLVGWSEDLNDVRVWTEPKEPEKPVPPPTPVSTPWTRTRKRLLDAINHPDAKAIQTSRVRIRAFLATIRRTLAVLPKN